MNAKSDSTLLNTAIGVVCIAAPMAVGMISAGISGDQMKSFGSLEQPPLSPPGWLFPIVWTILYIVMGIVLLMIVRSDHEYKVGAIALFICQLLLNFLWSPSFFLRQNYVESMVILILMLVTTVILAAIVWKINMVASVMLFPYILWMCFAAYLNAGVGMLNG